MSSLIPKKPNQLRIASRYYASRLEELLFEYAEDEEAADYLDNADFFSDRIRNNAWGIDTSYPQERGRWLLHWYDKVIKEFPKTNAAHIAYIRTFKTLVGR